MSTFNAPVDVNFQEFSYGQAPVAYGDTQAYYNYPPAGSDKPVERVTFRSIRTAFSTGDNENEPGLLEELGINFSHIFTKVRRTEVGHGSA